MGDNGEPATKKDFSEMMQFLQKIDGNVTLNTQTITKIDSRIDTLDSTHMNFGKCKIGDYTEPVTKTDLNKMMQLVQKIDGNVTLNTQAITRIHSRLDTLDSTYVKQNNKVEAVENVVKPLESSVFHTKNKTILSAEEYQAALLKKIKILEAIVQKQKIEMNRLRRHQARYMGDNVVIHGSKESAEYDRENDDKACQRVEEFVLKQMKMARHIPYNIEFDRYHRMPTGKNKIPTTLRPVVMNFISSTQKKEFIAYRNNVDKSTYQITDQFPAEWSHKRLMLKLASSNTADIKDKPQISKELVNDKSIVRGKEWRHNVDESTYQITDKFPAEWSDKRLTLKLASNNGAEIKDIPQGSMKVVHVVKDKLIVCGKEYVPPKLNPVNAPLQSDPSSIHWKEDMPKIVTSEPLTDKTKGNAFVGYTTGVHSEIQANVLLDVLHELMSKQGRAVADNMMHAYRVDSAGRTETTDTIVIVCRLFKGHIGPDKWKAIEGLTNTVLQSLLFDTTHSMDSG